MWGGGGGRQKALFFSIFVFWSFLTVVGLGVVEWSKKSYLKSAEIASFCFWFYSRMEDVS